MSVDIELLITCGGLDPRRYVTEPPFIGSVCFQAGQGRGLGLRIGYDEVPGNPYHGEVWGHPTANRFSGHQVRGLAQAAIWYVSIDDVELT